MFRSNIAEQVLECFDYRAQRPMLLLYRSNRNLSRSHISSGWISFTVFIVDKNARGRGLEIRELAALHRPPQCHTDQYSQEHTQRDKEVKNIHLVFGLGSGATCRTRTADRAEPRMSDRFW